MRRESKDEKKRESRKGNIEWSEETKREKGTRNEVEI